MPIRLEKNKKEFVKILKKLRASKPKNPNIKEFCDKSRELFALVYRWSEEGKKDVARNEFIKASNEMIADKAVLEPKIEPLFIKVLEYISKKAKISESEKEIILKRLYLNKWIDRVTKLQEIIEDMIASRKSFDKATKDKKKEIKERSLKSKIENWEMLGAIFSEDRLSSARKWLVELKNSVPVRDKLLEKGEILYKKDALEEKFNDLSKLVTIKKRGFWRKRSKDFIKLADKFIGQINNKQHIKLLTRVFSLITISSAPAFSEYMLKSIFLAKNIRPIIAALVQTKDELIGALEASKGVVDIGGIKEIHKI